MDTALLLLALAGDPVRIDARTAWFATPGGPLVVPVECLPAAERVRHILAEARLPLGQRVASALRWGSGDAALRLAATSAVPLTAEPGLMDALKTWAAAEAVRLGVASEGALTVVGADGVASGADLDQRSALADACELLAPLAWPRWAGPLVLVPWGVAHPAIAPGRARVVRPALPVLRQPAGPGARGELTAAIAALALDLSDPPAGGWPGWLTAGVGGCARARADGSGLAERPMAERRASAGETAIAALLAGAPPDPALATAVVAALLHPSRRARLPDLLERLRRGADGAAALAAAYRLNPRLLAGGP